MSALTKYEAARGALADCKSVDEVKGWADRAAATQAYARMAKDKGLEVDAAEIRIRAERRLGEMLRDQKAAGGMSKGGRPPETGSVEEPVNSPTLAEVGIDKKLSARAQRIAAVPEPEFEAEVKDWRGRVEEEGVRVSARLEAAGAKAVDGAPEGYSQADFDAECEADAVADVDAMAKIIAADDRLVAAMKEISEAKRREAAATALYDEKSREVSVITKEAARWMKKARKSAACQGCMTALERE